MPPPARGTKKPFTGWFFPATGGPFPSHPSFFYAARKRDRKCDLFFVAEKEGFEPSRQSPQPTPLAGEPLTATWVLLQLNILLKNWRRERDSNPRCLAASLVFKTSSINHSDISPRSQRYDYNRTSAACQQQKRQKWIYIIFLSLPCSSPSCSPPRTDMHRRGRKSSFGRLNSCLK